MRLVALIILVPGRASNLAEEEGEEDGGEEKEEHGKANQTQSEQEKHNREGQQNTIRRGNKTQSGRLTKHNQEGETKHNQERRPGSSTRGLADCVQVVSIGAVPAIVVILFVGAMPGDGRQNA